MSDLLNQASLVMVPSGYKEDTVYSVVPSDGSGDLSFTRASNGTRINSAGLVEVCPWNFIEYSEQFTNAAWATSNGATVSADQTTAPNGTTTADKIVFPANSAANIYNFPSSPIGANNISIYAKTLSGTKQFRLRIDTGSGPAVSSNFTATTEWQRFDFAVTTTATNLVAYVFNDSVGVAGDLYVWGAQLNIGSTAKPYFPTTDRLNVPRLTYQNGGGGCPSLLLEKQSTNISAQSEDFNGWGTKINITTTANYATSPDGTTNASRLQFTGSGFMYGNTGFGQTSGTVYTLSCYAKRNGSGTQSVGFFVNGSGGVDSAWSLTSEYQRFTYTYTAGNNSTVGIGGASGADVSVWGWQFEASYYPTSYISTTSASATRVADACFKTGISSLIGQSEGTIYWEGYVTPCGASNSMASVEVLNTTFINLRLTDINRIELDTAGLSTDFTITSSSPATSGTYYKIAGAYKSGDNVLYVNGVQIGTSATTYTTPTLTDFNFNVWNVFNEQKTVGQAILFKTRLTNAELASLTTI